MRIIKPYGRSETEFEEEGKKKLRRAIRRKSTLGTPNDTPNDIVAFATTHPELVIAQWISAIDKIAAKPRGTHKPTPEQRALRQQLGEAAWKLLGEKNLLSDFSQSQDELTRRWWSKIHPYGKETDDKERGNPKGRWYVRFAGDVEVSKVDAAAIAKKIHEHLYEREYRIHTDTDRSPERKGRVEARALSIRDNVLRLPPDEDTPWTDEDKKQYAATGNVAQMIADKAKAREQENRRVSMHTAAPILYGQYGRLFTNDDGSILPISEACENFSGLFALHMAVKDAYTRLLKHHKKKAVAHILPQDMPALFRLVESKADNRALNALVRLGKVIHYEATPSSGRDTPRNVLTNWPDDITHSRYWTSQGQAEIKRTEAFVRVWRYTVVLAAQTLKDWADPNGKIPGDILRQATIEQFDPNAYRKKLPILFGNQADLFETEDDAAILGLALSGWDRLRNSSFHFAGLGAFTAALTGNVNKDDAAAVAAARRLWKDDLENRVARLIETLRTAHVEEYFEQSNLNALVKTIVGAELPKAPLPRFRRVLARAENAWQQQSNRLHLPSPDNRTELENNPGRLCRYIATRTVYERAFPAWLEQQSAQTLNAWIERAVEHATEAAQSKDESAVARATGVIRLSEKQDIAHFFDELSAKTATELRVQRGYDSDADKAREQAKYLDNLRCDVVALAFEEYLNANALAWVLDDLGDGPLPEQKQCRLDDVPPLPERSEEDGADWEAVLYFLIHLVPVDAIGRLQHQIRKWSILEKKPWSDAEAVQRIFGLYRDMHDAKFEGGAGMTGAEALKDLFESEATFRQVCPEQPGQDAGQYVPYRGLREIRRFGGLGALRPIFEKYRISTDQVKELADLEATADGDSPIAAQQKQREDLHEKWTRKKNRFSQKDKTAYGKALAAVVRHRHLAAQVRLNNHARLYRLLMQVLGRLVDYAGLWERDLYFVTLALLSQHGKTPQQVFPDAKEKRLIEEGQIVAALRGLKNEPDGQQLLDQVKKMFGGDFPSAKKGGIVSVRNDLMHFNMLQGPNPALNLTETVNQTRRLMAYDRKLKNAVSKSVVEMLAREGFDLTWKMAGHELTQATVKTRQALHLGGKKIRENLHGETFVAMVATLFGGESRPTDDVCSIDFDKTERNGHSPRSPKRGKNRRNRRGNRGRRSGFSSRKG